MATRLYIGISACAREVLGGALIHGTRIMNVDLMFDSLEREVPLVGLMKLCT